MMESEAQASKKRWERILHAVEAAEASARRSQRGRADLSAEVLGEADAFVASFAGDLLPDGRQRIVRQPQAM